MRRTAEDSRQELVCAADRLAFPVRDGIPVMLEGEARPSTHRPKPQPTVSFFASSSRPGSPRRGCRASRWPTSAALPMIVRVAQRAALSQAAQVVVAADDAEIVAACDAHGVRALLTRTDHASGSDRLAEACAALGLDGDEIVVNVQGDEPLIEPALIDACAALLAAHPDCVMSTAAHAIDDLADFANPNVVKVVLDARGRALYFSPRADSVAGATDRAAGVDALPDPRAAAPRRPLRLPRRLPAPLSQLAARPARGDRGARAAARALARRAHRGARERAGAGRRRRHAEDLERRAVVAARAPDLA